MMSFVKYFTTVVFVVNLQMTVGEPLVKVQNGEMRGLETTYNGRIIHQYKGIPYAEPPVGSLRFKSPTPSKNWDAVFNATRYGASCMQVLDDSLYLENSEVSEDCLTLNIFVPAESVEFPMAIMVYIHGGSFRRRQGQAYNPIKLVAAGEIIAVHLNYRLGPFGFLSTEDEHAPGNSGLWDQLLAIQWIRENAVAFGGDPDRITIYGESAGGMSVSLLVMSPHSQGVFQRAISQSGVFYDYIIRPEPLKDTQTLGRLLDCKDINTEILVECIQAVSAEDVLSASNEISYIPWYPIVDGNFLTEKPSAVTKGIGNFDYIIGFTEMEGFLSASTAPWMNQTVNSGATVDEFQDLIRYSTYSTFENLLNPCTLNLLYKNLAFTYTYWEDVENAQERLLRMVKFLGDTTYVVPSYEMTVRHRDQSIDTRAATYQYYFTYKSTNPNLTIYSDHFAPSWNKKATHSDDLEYLFFPEKTHVFNEKDRNVSETMITYWTNFARTGNPNLPNNRNLPLWREFGSRGEYVEIADVTQAERDATDLDPEIMTLGLEYLPKLARDICYDETEGGLSPWQFNSLATFWWCSIVLLFAPLY